MPGNKKWIFVLLAAACGLSAVNFFYGYAEDSDARILIERAWEFGTAGYGPSRNWGFPLYELAAYPLLYYGGIFWAKLFSLLVYLLSGILFFHLLKFLIRGEEPAFWGALCFLVHPLMILNGNSIAESSLAIFFSVAALCFLARHLSDQKGLNLCAAAFFCGLASATRQDYLMLSGAVAVTALLFGTKNLKIILLAAAVFAAAAAGPYLWMYGSDHFWHLNTEFFKNDPYLRIFLRAILGFLSLLGPPTLLLAAAGIFLRRISWRSTPWNCLFLFAFFLYFLRFSFDADKLEYILGIWPVFLVAALLSLKSRKALLLLLLATLLPNFLQIHFFRREGRFTRAAVGFSPGVLAQEQSERLKQEYIFLGEHEAVLKEAAEKKFGCERYITYLLDAEDADLCMVVQEERLRFWNPERAAGKIDLQKALQKRIIVYPLPDHRGWRQWIRYEGWHKPTLEEFRVFPN